MKNKAFANFTNNDCLEHYSEFLINSEKKRKDADILAKAGSYDTAISLAIISLEEMIKGILVLADGCGFKFRRIKGINTLFRNHDIRYFIAFGLFSVSLVEEDFMKFMAFIINNPSEILNLIQKMENNDPVIEKKLKWFLLRKFSLLKKEFAWFYKVNIFRQDGFYWNFHKTKITIENYLDVTRRIDKVRQYGDVIIPTIKSGGYAALTTTFQAEDYYSKIENVLGILSRSKQSPFDLISKKIAK
jgi:AbiV family abortive infection protein